MDTNLKKKKIVNTCFQNKGIYKALIMRIYFPISSLLYLKIKANGTQLSAMHFLLTERSDNSNKDNKI